MTGAVMAASAVAALHLSGTVTVTCANDTRIDSGLASHRCRGFDVDIATNDYVGAAMGSRSPTSLSGVSVDACFTERDAGGAGAISFVVKLNGNWVGKNPFTQVVKKNGGSTEDTLARTSAVTPAGVLDGSKTYWQWSSITTEWPTSGSRDAVFS